MKRLALNGSPRGEKSNSRLVLRWMIEGMKTAGVEAPEILDLARTKEVEAARAAFLQADEVLLVFPLYTDSFPGVVKHFIDSLADAPRERLVGKRIAFVVQSGFPESIQSEAVVAYLERLARRLGMTHAGSAIRGNSEGLRLMPEQMTMKAHAQFAELGRSLVADGFFDQASVDRLARPRRLSLLTRFAYRFLAVFGVTNLYWNMMLKKNGAFEKRFDAPYAARA